LPSRLSQHRTCRSARARSPAAQNRQQSGKLDQDGDGEGQQDFYGGTVSGRRLAGEQQVEQWDNQQHERNRVHDDTGATQPEQARGSEQSGNNQHDAADEQRGINGAYNYAQD
jgi:hypothetical protein